MKRITKLSYLFMVLLFLLASSGCNKVEQLTKEELLTNHIWKWNKITTNSTDTDVQSLVALVNALMTGTTLDFKDDGTYVMTSPLDPNNPTTGTWELSEDSKTLDMDGEPGDIVKLSSSEFVIAQETVDEQYGTYTVTLYWKK
jgi:Lipocalin-like domain